MALTPERIAIATELRYHLLAILQFTLDGMERCEKGIEDARELGADEVMETLRRIHRDQGAHIEALRRLLDQDGQYPKRGSDVVEQASIDSFPASDAPGY